MASKGDRNSPAGGRGQNLVTIPLDQLQGPLRSLSVSGGQRRTFSGIRGRAAVGPACFGTTEGPALQHNRIVRGLRHAGDRGDEAPWIERRAIPDQIERVENADLSSVPSGLSAKHEPTDRLSVHRRSKDHVGLGEPPCWRGPRRAAGVRIGANYRHRPTSWMRSTAVARLHRVILDGSVTLAFVFHLTSRPTTALSPGAPGDRDMII